jgi:hypothetical protein
MKYFKFITLVSTSVKLRVRRRMEITKIKMGINKIENNR